MADVKEILVQWDAGLGVSVIARTLGYRPDELIGLKVENLISVTDGESVLELFRRLAPGGRGHVECQIRKRDGYFLPVEVSATNRYTITSYEAAITARRRIKEGETIKYLTGTLVPLTAEESNDLDLTQRNFSIVVSSRRKNGSIFLGPARFANHDCDANGRLVPTGNDGMEVRAMKNIEVGEEINDDVEAQEADQADRVGLQVAADQ